MISNIDIAILQKKIEIKKKECLQYIYLTTLFKKFLIHVFLFKNNNMSILSGESLFLLGASICPTIEKACSLGQEVAGIEENFFTTGINGSNRGLQAAFSFHQRRVL